MSSGVLRVKEAWSYVMATPDIYGNRYGFLMVNNGVTGVRWISNEADTMTTRIDGRPATIEADKTIMVKVHGYGRLCKRNKELLKQKGELRWD